MRNYELIFIIHPDLDETAATETVEKVSGWISESGGSVDKVDLWGKRQLAYPIRKQKDGQYVLIQAQMDPSFGTELERNLRFQEPVMRFLLTKVE
jgi:small subunit ribosomal protein S6